MPLLPSISFSPLTLKRLRRFRANRRAWLSLGILAALYGLSLGAELLCNDRPIYLRISGRNYFPVFRYHSQHELFGNHVHTRPDYARLAQTPGFTNNPHNRAIFPPFRSHPRAVLDPDQLASQRLARLTITPAIASGRFNLTAEGRITRAENLTAFMEAWEAQDATAVFTNYWEIPPALDQAIRQRFANQAAPSAEARLVSLTSNRLEVLASLAAFEPRAVPPASVRIGLRQTETPATAPMTLDFRNAAVRPEDPPAVRPRSARAWRRVPAAARDSLLECARQVCREDQVVTRVPWGTSQAEVRGLRTEITWPHRPVPGHRMGVDAAGRDVLARVLYGLRTSLTFGLLLVAWAMLLGCVVGAVQGYFGGWVDIAAQRVIEIWSALPFLYIMILVGAVLGRGFGLLLLCYGLFNWIGMSYYLRAEFLRLRSRPFVEAARCQGLGPVRIIFRHILPNALTPLITLFPFSLVGAVSALTALDYLGFGLPPLTPSWGELLQQAQTFRWAWWLIAYPSLALFTVMILTVLVGEGLRDAFDPRPFTRLE